MAGLANRGHSTDLMPGGAALEEIIASEELLRRPLLQLNPAMEREALHSLAQGATRNTAMVLHDLARLAVDLCQAGSGGVSLIETGEDGNPLFRWRALSGRLESYEGGSTPRDWSPCGECLKRGKAVLYSHPARYFTYFADVPVPIVEGLVIPMYLNQAAAGTIWIVSHDERCRFNAEHVRVMTSLGAFAAGALHLAQGGLAPRPANSESLGRSIVWREYVRRIALRDTLALAALIEETQPLVFAAALRVLSFRQDAEEIASDVYARVWEIGAAYDPCRGTVAAWLVNMARSRAVNQLRVRARLRRWRQIEKSGAALHLECGRLSNPEHSAAAGEESSRVRSALNALPASQRQAIELAYFRELTIREIAAEVGQPAGTVKTRIRLGLMRLRRLLAAVE